MRRAIKHSQAIYCFGSDTLLIAWIATRFQAQRFRLVYEVGDIRALFLATSVTGRVLRWLERLLLRHVDLLVVTSKAYIDGYFRGIQGLDNLNYQVIENKLFRKDLPQVPMRAVPSSKESKPKITIGYFGLIRCRQSWKVLKEVASQGCGRVRIYIRGILMGLEDLEEEIRRSEHIELGKPYVSPDDLPSMYGQVDLAWIAHYHGRPNTQWARANRFYEACGFQCPLIAQVGTQDGFAVMEHNIGRTIDICDVQAATQDVLEITADDIRSWRNNLATLPRDTYMYTDEHKKLVSRLASDG